MTEAGRTRSPMTQPTEVTFRARHVELRGESIGSGPTLVLLHAGGERRTVWRPVAARLAAQGVCAVSVDQRGHGDTAGPFGSHLSIYADDVVAIVRSLGTRVTLAGCSLGGLAALLAATDPEVAQRLDGMVLVDVIPDPDPTRARRHLRAARRLPKSHHRPEPPWSLIEDVLCRSNELRNAAAAVRAPITLIRGTSSWAIDAEDQQRFSNLAPQASLVTIEGAGHLVARDRPDELAEALLDHLDHCKVEEERHRVAGRSPSTLRRQFTPANQPVLHPLSTVAPSIGGADPAS
jgi:pimeloyl-ACP methyl ester carboxylesterase